MLVSRSVWFVSFTWFLFVIGRSQAQTNATTDPVEVKTLNTILARWGVSADSTWNISGEPCNGRAIDSTIFDDTDFNPAIKCECTYNKNTLCHITKLKVFNLNVVGPIPDELSNLKFLNNLLLSENFLSGPLPAFIGNFTALEYFTVGYNSLSGPIPKELGNLRKLISMGLNANKFGGSLPPELGNLANLEQLYIDSSELNGEIPSSFSKLQKLKIWRASDNNFTGRVPDFIGNLTNLAVLRLQGNAFQGPIPASWANLTNLTDLRIGELTNGSSNLDFIRDMKSLNILVIRNSMIFGSIPSYIGEFSNLNHLDLSFNNLTGVLPPSLFNLSSLAYLFLGNNSLSGSLPSERSTKLVNIDLSYNNFSGSFPPWVSNTNIQLNLVANNFLIDNSNNSVLPSGLNCLQRSIPCNRGSPRYSSVAINCGGNASVTASDGTVYDTDNANVTTASYFVNPELRWGVSNVGRFLDASNPNYIWNTLANFPNTSDPALFQTSRHSPSSLRYYGLGLENGNYTIKMDFSETAIESASTWKSLGRRVFDIYIQGKLAAKDFDITKEAGGTTLTAVTKEFTAPVTSNFLEIHFFWAGKGTCCIPFEGYYGSSVSAISLTPNFNPSVSNQPPNTGSKKPSTGLISGVIVGSVVICFLIVFGLIWRFKKRQLNIDDDEELLGLMNKPDSFSYAELKSATEDFNPANKLGEGGFGAVYKGKLSDGREVAVKQLSVASLHGKRQFVSEIATISTVQHRNLVRLYGCCYEGDRRLLVYEYLENKSLDQALFGESSLKLEWATRFEICLGTARGLAYLHEESRLRIIHRDVKASNILLDEVLIPKISDFGLAKLYDDNKTHISTRVAGTIGYLAPEYAMRGRLSEKADVFGFGVVALEIVCGRRNTESTLGEDKMYLLEWAWQLHETNADMDMIDSKLPSYSMDEALRVIKVALLCTQASPSLRPSMSRVVGMLVGDMEISDVNSRPGYLTDWQFDDITAAIEDNSFSTNPTDASGSKISEVTGSSTSEVTGGDFNESNKLGEGGFGPVYKGVLLDGREVAVKKLSVASAQGKRQFVTEIATISAVQHRNLVKLYGCCYEGDRRLLVLEYLENRSLDQVLFGNSNLHIDWPARFKICLGTARGLAYLHEESSIRFVHRDVKASNILLDADLNPKVSDFGLAKLRDDTKSHISTGVAGTVGYLAPEYAMRGQLTEKADVFGFGVVVLEILCGRRNTDQSLGQEKMYLLEWAWHLHEEKRDLEMIDPTLSSYNQDEVKQLIGVAFLCTQASPTRRPSMSRVVAMLVGDMEVSEVMTKPSYLMDWRYTEFSSTQTSGQSTAATTSGKDELKPASFSGMPSSTPAQAMLGIDEGR